jgi:hypothetical protein
VILVGNKIDLRGGEVTNEGLEDEVAPIMREFKVSRVVSAQIVQAKANVDCRKWRL